MMYSDIRELHDMIADAVKEGILAAYKEINMGGAIESSTKESKDSYDNAKAYCARLKAYFSSNIIVYSSDLHSLAHEMKKILSADECRYVVTHIHEFVGSGFSKHANEFVKAYASLTK